jgi:hypothetical protein
MIGLTVPKDPLAEDLDELRRSVLFRSGCKGIRIVLHAAVNDEHPQSIIIEGLFCFIPVHSPISGPGVISGPAERRFRNVVPGSFAVRYRASSGTDACGDLGFRAQG